MGNGPYDLASWFSLCLPRLVVEQFPLQAPHKQLFLRTKNGLQLGEAHLGVPASPSTSRQMCPVVLPEIITPREQPRTDFAKVTFVFTMHSSDMALKVFRTLECLCAWDLRVLFVHERTLILPSFYDLAEGVCDASPHSELHNIGSCSTLPSRRVRHLTR